MTAQPHDETIQPPPSPQQTYTSVTQFLSTASALDNGTVNTDSNGDTIITTRIRLTDNPDEESVDVSALDHQEIDRLRDADPFMYHSILRERRRRSSLFGLEDDEEEDGERMEFDLAAMDQLRAEMGRSSVTGGPLRLSVHSVSDDGISMDNSSGSGGMNMSRNHSDEGSVDGGGSHHSGGGSHHSGGIRMSRPAAGGRRRSSLFNVSEGDESTDQADDPAMEDPADSGGGAAVSRVNSRRADRPFSRSFSQVSNGSEVPTGRAQRRHSCNFHSLGSSVVARKRRFSTEAHSSLIMANIEASLRGSTLSDSPDLDSILDAENSEGSDSDDDLLGFLR